METKKKGVLLKDGVDIPYGAKFAIYFDADGNEVAVESKNPAITDGSIMKLLHEKGYLDPKTNLTVNSKSVLHFYKSPGCTIWIGNIPIKIC